MDGILNVDKPDGMSSARVVAAVKRLLPRGTKIGHAGTLDPFATGVLLLLVGRATKRCESLMDQSKQYEATVKLGATTATDDLDSPEVVQAAIRPPDAAAIVATLPQFTGMIQQRPPAFSALKIGGRRAYDMARSGEAVPLAARPVVVYGIEMLEYAWPLLRLRIDCGRGTYIRSIARDVGAALQTGGYLVQLCRTRVGSFSLEGAAALADLSTAMIGERLITIEPPF